MASISLVLEVIEECGSWKDDALLSWAAWLDGEASRAAGNGCASRVEELSAMASAVRIVLSARSSK